MTILLCTEVEERFSSYLDGTLSGTEMVNVQEHMKHCSACTVSFADWQATVATLGSLGSAKAPPMLALQLRVAVSRRRARTLAHTLDRLKVQWRDSVEPLGGQASAGLASLVLMLGTLTLLLGTFAAPEQAAARSSSDRTATGPRFLYVSQPGGFNAAESLNGSVVVRVYVDASGRVYDYRVLSGATNPRNKSVIANEMLWSVFEPAHVFGEPVRGSLILSMAGVSVPG